MVYYKETTLRFLVWNLVEDPLKLTLSLLEYERTRKRNGQRVFLCCILFRFELWLIIVSLIIGPSFLPSMDPACLPALLPACLPSLCHSLHAHLPSLLPSLTDCLLPSHVASLLPDKGRRHYTKSIAKPRVSCQGLVQHGQSTGAWGSRRHNSSGHWVP